MTQTDCTVAGRGMSRGYLLKCVALLFLAGLALRLTVLAVPPVIPQIHADLNLSETEVGILTGLPQVVISLIKATLFGLSAGLIACYKGLSVGGGPTGVGNAVSETVVFSFMALFFINIVITALGVKVTAK